MIVLGITGGVGSGKSRILNELKEKYNAYVVEADKLAHELMEPCQPIYDKIVQSFGMDILVSAGGEIDRRRLGDIVFKDREKLELLNSITHPGVKEKIIEMIDQKKKEGNTGLFVIEAALLIQDGYKEICDEIWYIWVSKEERIKRLANQRGYSEEKCEDMFSSQEDDEYYKKYADFTINNALSYENSSKQLKARLIKLFPNGIMN